MAHRTHGIHRELRHIDPQENSVRSVSSVGKYFKLRGKQKSVGASAVAVYLAMYAVVDVVCVEVY